jgi:hypothetical protein
MKIKTVLTITLIASTLMISRSAWADSPTIDFSGSGVTAGNVAPGTNVAWLGMVRERIDDLVRVRFVRGTAHATAQSTVSISEPDANASSSLWGIINVGSGENAASAAPLFGYASGEIAVHAPIGQSSIKIESPAVELLYVRPAVGVWSAGTGDGSDLDLDLEPNGVVELSLATLKPLGDSPAAPATVQQGDVLVLIDPQGIRLSHWTVTE